METRETSGKAIAALILGICGFVALPLICSLLAISCANAARADIERSYGRLGGAEVARAGTILGWIGVCICVFFLALAVFALANGAHVNIWFRFL